MPPITRTLIYANVAVFFAQIYSGANLIGLFGLWPGALAPWQPVTYAFLHGGISHLLFNMLGLYMMGAEVERVLGAGRYLRCYLFSVVAGAATQLIVAWLTQDLDRPVIGASAGVFGLVLAYAMYFPRRQVMLLFPPIPMQARTFAAVYAVAELVLGVTGTQSGIAHFAHLGGMLGAYLSIRHFPGERAHWR
ncbi:MAG: rhomboid family intramembrane serine protease [Burkholderiales bacterium]